MIRFKLVFWALILGFLFIINRLFFIQILNPNRIIPLERYIQLEKQPSLRGEVYDANGRPLVLNKKKFDVYANIGLLKENRTLQNLLRQELGLKKSTLSAVLKLSDWRRVARGIEEGTKAKLDEYYPEYLNFESEWARHYPEGSSSAHLLGFLGRDEVGEPKGYTGLEGYFDQELSGLPTVKEQESDFIGIPFIGGVVDRQRDFSGMDLFTTVDLNVQKIMESHLWEGRDRYRARQACAIIIEPRNGHITAMGCVPGFDPQKYPDYRDADFLNPLIAAVYEPGSTFKPLVVAMALEEGRIKANTVVEEKGPYKMGEYAVKTWDDNYRGRISVQQVLEKSSNVGMVQIIRRLPEKKVDGYFHQLGLRTYTGIELEGEVNSLIKDYQEWYPIDFATLSFGQGMAITPVQLVKAFTAIANDGIVVKPTVVDHFYDRRTGSEVKTDAALSERVFSRRTTDTLKKFLQASVDNSEAIWPQKPSGYAFCGKTGTAQIPIAGHYDPTKTIASFIGFLPCQNPKFLMLTLYHEPESSPWGSETAAPTFFEIAKSLILYYNIPPQY